MTLQPGSRGTAELTVSAADTARALRSGDVDALATPRLVALCEQAAVSAVAGQLDPDTTTVGVRISLDHEAPTPVGGRVTASAVLESVQDKRLEFVVEASDGSGRVATGLHVRVIVRRDRFAESVAARGRG